ncbi:hypothetical protein AAC387_Pa12g1893 [Persea americana]
MEHEIRWALFSIIPSKAPGLDSFNAKFFQVFWNMVKGDLCSTVLDLFARVNLESRINETAIILIPKKENPRTFKKFRLISLCNVTYKLILKIMVHRLRPILSRLIFPNHGAFVPRRKALDQIVVAREMVHTMSKMKGSRPTIAVKLDVEEAYDTLRWDFLQACLTKLGFNMNFISKIMLCVSSVTFTVRVNGSHSEKFRLERGLRQVTLFLPIYTSPMPNPSLGVPPDWRGRVIWFSLM